MILSHVRGVDLEKKKKDKNDKKTNKKNGKFVGCEKKKWACHYQCVRGIEKRHSLIKYFISILNHIEIH